MSSRRIWLRDRFSAVFQSLVLIFDLLFFSLVSPNTNSSLLVLLGCLLLGLSIYVTLRFFVGSVATFVTISVMAQRRFAIFAAVFAIFLLMMQSIGQLGLRDIIAALALAAVLYLYISYRHNKKQATY